MDDVLWAMPHKLLRLLPLFLPALFLAFAMGLACQRWYRQSPAAGAPWMGFMRLVWRRFAWGSAVLLGGLILTQNDGRMLTYVTLVVCLAVREWLWLRRAYAPKILVTSSQA